MFKCQLCGKTVPPRTPPTLVVLETRPMIYQNEKVDPETEEIIPITSAGWEIVRERKACPECAGER